MSVTTCQKATGFDIGQIEDLLVSLAWHRALWSIFERASSKQCRQRGLNVEAVWCFHDRGDAELLASRIAEAFEGERCATWVEPVIGGNDHCTYLALHSQILVD